MSTKALKRELAAAIAMLLVAMIALSGSTYAWFASNNKVEAQNMSVTAMSDAAFLEITVSGGAFTGSSVTAAALSAGSTTSTGALYPVTPFTLSNTDASGEVQATLAAIASSSAGKAGTFTWSYTYSDDVDKADKGSTMTWKTVGAPDNHTLEESCLMNDFYFRMSVEDVTGKNLKVSAADFGSSVTKLIDQGVTVLVAGKDGYAVITADGTITAYDASGAPTGSSDAILYETVPYAADQASAIQVSVYVYYNGEHANVTTTNLKDIAGATLASLSFMID